MKKQIMALTAAIAVIMSMTASVSAATNLDTEVLKGTPIVDGKLDDNYKKSASYSMDYESNVGWSFGTGKSDGDAEITSYFLYDDDYFYVFHHVTDDNVTTPTDETIFTEQSKHYCKIDEVEVIFMDATGTNNLTKVLVDGNGKMVQLFSMQTVGTPLAAIDVENAPEYSTSVPSVKGYLDSQYGDMSKISPVKAAYAKTDDGYDVELAIPLKKDYIDNGFAIQIQLSDVDDSTGMENGQFLQPKDVLVIKLSNRSAGNTPVETVSDDNKSEATVAPATADGTAALLLAVVSCGIAFTAVTKSKKN